MARASEPGGGVRYDLPRARWDRPLAPITFIILLVVGAMVGVFEFFLAVGVVLFAAALSEWSSRLLNYVILHAHHVDISRKPWFAKTRGQKWRIPYRDIFAVNLNENTAEITRYDTRRRHGLRGGETEKSSALTLVSGPWLMLRRLGAGSQRPDSWPRVLARSAIASAHPRRGRSKSALSSTSPAGDLKVAPTAYGSPLVRRTGRWGICAHLR